MLKVGLVTLAATTSLSVLPGTQENSGYVISPAFIPGETVRGDSFSLTSTESTAKGENTGVMYSELGYLENDYARGDRNFPLHLMEEDFVGGDDKVKTYEVYFDYDYVTLVNIALISTDAPGEIDESDDPTAELYLNGNMQKLAGDPVRGTNLFYYDITLN